MKRTAQAVGSRNLWEIAIEYRPRLSPGNPRPSERGGCQEYAKQCYLDKEEAEKMTSNTRLGSILGFVQDGKKVLQEFQELSPMIKDQIASLVSELKSVDTTDQQIYDAIQFTINKMRQKPHIVMGVYKDDPPELIKEIYYLKAKYYHPDSGGKHANVEKFNELNNAYNKLKG